MNVEGESRVLLVTSIHPGEGKTFTSKNLASIYARSGKKVVLIDFDLHKPKVHKVLNLDNSIGSSVYLSGNTEIENIIQKEVEENLDVILKWSSSSQCI